jgi:serine/threonine protein kinase
MFPFQVPDTDTAPQRFCREVMAWKTLRHPNILPLIGVVVSQTQFAMISDWMANGNINNFIKTHPDANRLELVGFALKALLSSLRVR